jgi:hypothetical protein
LAELYDSRRPYGPYGQAILATEHEPLQSGHLEDCHGIASKKFSEFGKTNRRQNYHANEASYSSADQHTGQTRCDECQSCSANTDVNYPTGQPPKNKLTR